MMKNRIISIIVCTLLIVGIMPTAVLASDSEDIIILFENDVHCSIEGYSKLAALKNELLETNAYVGVVSGGDYIQGNSIGVVSRGSYVAEIMNLVGYDAVTLGNHEFDFKLARLNELIDMMDTKPICCNFAKVGEEESYYKPYSIVSYGDVDIAYIGIITPSTITTSSPAQFKDENGNFLYTFNSTDLYGIVQKNIDAAKAEGADHIIAVSHVGYADDAVYGDLEDVETLIRNTSGFDVVLDAHSHTVLEGVKVTDKSGREVLLSSTGTQFEYIGKLTISDDGMKTELIKTADYPATDPVVDAYIESVYEEYDALTARKVAETTVDLRVQDEDGNRLVRRYETNVGDLCADAFRYAVDADVSFVQGGGLRADIPAGDVTLMHLLNLLPFNNTLLVGKVSGQTLKDMMEMAMMIWPAENGSFPHLAGITFSVNTAIESSVVLNEYDEFVCVDGEYRVYDIMILNRETGKYEPIDLSKTYTLAAVNYFLLDFGSGMTMLESAEIVRNDGMLDIEAVEKYVNEQLGGVIGEQYGEVSVNITFTDGVTEDVTESTDETSEPTETAPEAESGSAETSADTDASDSSEADGKPSAVIAVCIAAAIVIAAIVIILLIKKRRGAIKGTEK